MNPFTMFAIIFSAIGRTFRVADKWAAQAEMYSDKTIGAQRAQWAKDENLAHHIKLANTSFDEYLLEAQK